MRFVQTDPAAGESILFIHGGNVAGWMWRGQAEALPGFHSIIPDLPGFGASADEPWPTLVEVADDLADLVRTHAGGGRAHVVGLSLGGVLGVILAARHPDVVRSVFVTGAAVRGIRGLTRAIGLAQLPLWGSRSYWLGLARSFRLPADSVDEFVTTGLGIDRASAQRMMREVYDGVPAHVLDGLRGLEAPLLAIAGEREPRVVRAALDDIVGRTPHGTAAIAPRMHHVWSAEDPELFHRVLSHWLTYVAASPELRPA